MTICYFELLGLPLNEVNIDSDILELKYLNALSTSVSDENRCKLINNAYNILKDDILRIEYIINNIISAKDNHHNDNLSISNTDADNYHNLIKKQDYFSEISKNKINNTKMLIKYFDLNEQIEENSENKNKLLYDEYMKIYQNIIADIKDQLDLNSISEAINLVVELKFVKNIINNIENKINI